jgi:PAS domain S-box-containing protein
LDKRASCNLAVFDLLEAALECASEALLITNGNIDSPMITHVNAAFRKMTGYSAEEVVGKTPKILQGPKTSREVLNRLKAELKSGQSFFGRSVNYRKNGTEYVFEWHISAIVKEGSPVGFISIQRCLNDLPLATKEDLESLISNGDEKTSFFKEKFAG